MIVTFQFLFNVQATPPVKPLGAGVVRFDLELDIAKTFAPNFLVKSIPCFTPKVLSLVLGSVRADIVHSPFGDREALAVTSIDLDGLARSRQLGGPQDVPDMVL